jgi:predicted ATP-grasp superfamily ATP-dependent carboligase
MLENKARFHEFATAANLPTSAGFVISSAADLSGLERLSLPLTIKPAHKWHVYFGRTGAFTSRGRMTRRVESARVSLRLSTDVSPRSGQRKSFFFEIPGLIR